MNHFAKPPMEEENVTDRLQRTSFVDSFLVTRQIVGPRDTCLICWPAKSHEIYIGSQSQWAQSLATNIASSHSASFILHIINSNFKSIIHVHFFIHLIKPYNKRDILIYSQSNNGLLESH